MIRMIWFMLKLGVLVALVLWLAAQAGAVHMTWQGYEVRIHIGLFMVGQIAIILIAAFLYDIINRLVRVPSGLKRYRQTRTSESGYKAIAAGFNAIESGETKTALKQLKKARKYMPADHDLLILLEKKAVPRQTDDPHNDDTLASSANEKTDH